MKKLLFFLFITLLWSCKPQPDVKPNQVKIPSGKSHSLYGGDNLYDVLGYGIDITKDELDPNSVSLSPIINVTQFATAYASQLDSYLSQDNTSVGTNNVYSGSTILDYATSVTTSKGLSAGTGPSTGTGAIEGAGNATTTTGTTGTGTSTSANTKGALFTASISKNSSDASTSDFSSNYSYASAELTQRVRRLAFTGDVTVSMLMNYLTPAFVNDVNTLSADNLVARYGTHVLLDITIGGAMKFNYSTISTKTANTTTKTSNLNIALGATVAKVTGINLGYNNNSTVVNSITSTSISTQSTLQFYGGTNSGSSITLDGSGAVTNYTINFGTWASTVTPANDALISIGSALYIYDFITDPVKKAAVMTAVQNHIAAAQVIVGTDPVYVFYNPNNGGDHFTSANINATVGAANWQNYGIDFRAFLGQVPGTEPVYLFYNTPSGDHFTTADVNATVGAANWASYGVIFYAYKTQVAGSVPIYVYYNAAGGDHYTTSNPNIAAQYPGWVKDGVTFYAFPK
jgi:hypothetical protein